MIPSQLRPVFRPLRKYYLPFVLGRSRALNSDEELEQLITSIGESDSIVEIGANIGCASVQLAEKARQVYCFEPNPIAFKTLCRRSRKYRNIQCFNFAISDKDGMESLSFESDEALVSRFASLTHDLSGNHLKVQAKTLDSFQLMPSAILLDCEGSEIMALGGATKTLESTRLIVAETHYLNSHEGTFESLRSLAERNGFRDCEIVRSNAWSPPFSWEKIAKFTK